MPQADTAAAASTMAVSRASSRARLSTALISTTAKRIKATESRPGRRLVRRLTEDSVPAKAVLSALIAGPEDEGLLPLLPQDLIVRSAWVEGGTCTADLSGRLLDLPPEQRELALKSIVDTLCSLDTVEQVQILIDGEPAGEFGSFGLSGPLP